MNGHQVTCLFEKLAAIETAIGSISGISGATQAFRGSGATTIPAGAKAFSYVAVGGTITVGAATIPENLSHSVQTPGGLSADLSIANGTGTAYWEYTI